MTKTCKRFFAGALRSQARWLNKMSADGYRLTGTDISTYHFVSCEPNEYVYTVEYIGNKSQSHAEEYKHFLEDLGYKTFYKNINLNYSAGKIYARPWAEKGGRIATTATTHNRELLIVEKLNDGQPFELHTTTEDKISYLKSLCAPWWFSLFMLMLFAVSFQKTLLYVFSALLLIPILIFQFKIYRLKKEQQIQEF